jgi:hypothetical protein
MEGLPKRIVLRVWKSDHAVPDAMMEGFPKRIQDLTVTHKVRLEATRIFKLLFYLLGASLQ